MGLRMVGCGTFLGGVFLIWASFHTVDLGIARYKGIGEGEFLLTLVGLLIAGIGTLMTLARTGRRR